MGSRGEPVQVRTRIKKPFRLQAHINQICFITAIVMNCVSQIAFRTRRMSNKSKMGQIQLILGPMFSGKSTELIRRLKRYEIARYSCLIVKYAKDVRYDCESIATHDQQTLKAISADKLKDLKVNLEDYDVIGIDA